MLWMGLGREVGSEKRGYRVVWAGNGAGVSDTRIWFSQSSRSFWHYSQAPNHYPLPPPDPGHPTDSYSPFKTIRLPLLGSLPIPPE